MDEQAAERLLKAEREATLARIASVTADLQGIAASTDGSNVDDEHDPEGATIAFEREQLASLRDQAHVHLKEIDAALGRLSEHAYGMCERCGKPIAEERLVALPAVRLCVTCAAHAKR